MEITGEVYGLYCVCETCRVMTPEEVRYAGVTVEGYLRRLNNHLKEAMRGDSEKAKDRWIRKHGPDNIRSVLLEVTTGIEDLRIAEVAWIAKLGTFGTPRGLNMTRGGDGIWGYKFSDEVRERFRERTAQQMAVQHPRARVDEEDVKTIIKRIWAGESIAQIAKDYPISSSAIQRIRGGQNWPHVPRPDSPPPRLHSKGAPRITAEVREQIKQEHSGEWGELKRLALKFGISETSVSLIVNGHRD